MERGGEGGGDGLRLGIASTLHDPGNPKDSGPHCLGMWTRFKILATGGSVATPAKADQQATLNAPEMASKIKKNAAKTIKSILISIFLKSFSSF